VSLLRIVTRLPYSTFFRSSYSDEPHRATLWVHAVSVGEVNAAAPLVDALLRQRPGMRLLVTTITPTGSARVSKLWGDRVEHVYRSEEHTSELQSRFDLVCR